MRLIRLSAPRLLIIGKSWVLMLSRIISNHQVVPVLYRCFPLELTNLNLQIPGTNKPFVLEVRVLLKNAIMKHVIKEGSIFL